MTALKALLGRNITRLITSPATQWLRRWCFALPRRLLARPATVHVFYQPDDPYSQLLLEYLPALKARYGIKLEIRVVPAPESAAAPDQARLAQWSARDVVRLRASAAPPQGFPCEAVPTSEDTATLARNAALRKKWGHYLGATLYFEGEWYWGTDRLHYLEQRLQEAGLLSKTYISQPLAPLLPPKTLQFARAPAPTVSSHRLVIQFYCSLRSPYTYLAAAQIHRLAEHYGAELQLRFVLPMVMRGLPVPWAKRLYILRDTKREAVRLDLPFGCVADPVGKPVEDGLAILQAAVQRGSGPQFLEAFLAGVFAQGLDAGSSKNLCAFANAAGLSATEAEAALSDPTWRSVAEANRTEMLASGLWGVPSFRVNDKPMLWGQDRLWMLEEDLTEALGSP
jgi:2-hydroxychromene-2-carboxylate isomerase